MKKLLSYIILTGLFVGANSTNCGVYSWSKDQTTNLYQKAKRPMEALLKVGLPTGLAGYAFYEAIKVLPSLEDALANPNYPEYIRLNFEPWISASLMFLGLTMLGYSSLTAQKTAEPTVVQ